jgi:hypothetical protein
MSERTERREQFQFEIYVFAAAQQVKSILFHFLSRGGKLEESKGFDRSIASTFI